MTRFATLALGVALLVACAPDRERLLDEAFHDLEASALSGTPQPVSLAVSPDGRVAFGGGYNALWVQDARGSGGRYESIPGAYVTFVGETLFVGGSANNATTGAFFRSSDGWATLQPAGQTPLAVQHISADEARVAVTGGTEVWVLDRERFLAGAGEDEADLVLALVLRGELDNDLKLAVDVGLEGGGVEVGDSVEAQNTNSMAQRFFVGKHAGDEG